MKVYIVHILIAFVSVRSSVAAENLLRHGAPVAAIGHRFATNTDSHVCADEDELVLCDTSAGSKGKSCVGMEISQCNNVLCQNACSNSIITDSNVECVRDSSCEEATFRQSTVKCSEVSSTNCRRAEFYSSAAFCDHSSGWGSYRSCGGAQFNQCSCCEGVGCPSGATRCYRDEDSSDPSAFCASEVSGRTCKEWGNPICNEGEDQPSNLPEIILSDNIPRAICAGRKLNKKPILIATIRGSSQGSFQVEHEGELPPGVTCEHDHNGDSNSEVEVYLKGRPDATMEKGVYELKLHAIGEDIQHSPSGRRVPIITSDIDLRFSHCACRTYRCGRGKRRVCKSQTGTQDSETVCVGFRKARRLLARGGICGRCSRLL